MVSINNIEFNISDDLGIIKMFCNKTYNSIYDDIKQIKDQIKNNNIKAVIVCLYGEESVKSIKNVIEYSKEEKELFNFIYSLTIPCIAVISGYCYDIFLEISLICHIRILGKNAVFVYPGEEYRKYSCIDIVNYSIRAIGINSKNNMTDFINQSIDAEKALEINLCNMVFEEKELEENAKKYAQTLFNNRKKPVIDSVMKCYNLYRNIPISNNDEFDYEEEINQLCVLISKDYKNRQIKEEK